MKPTMTNPPHNSSRHPSDEPNEETFQLSRGWLLVGVLAVVVGLVSGVIMSSATFLR
jgi:hypothetical protein